MSQFMIEYDLPEFTEDFISRIPQQRLKINELLQAGKIHSYTVSADRSRMWCVLNAQSEFEVMEILSEFPMKDYLGRPTITSLMFHNSVVMQIPAFSLN